jgi:protein required for attachment to host cells
MTLGATWVAIAGTDFTRLVIHEGGQFRTLHVLCRPGALLDSSNHGHAAGAGPGRGGKSAGRARSRAEARATRPRHFNALCAAALNEAAAAGIFTRLVLVAPARRLRAFEEALDPAVRRIIVGRIGKSLGHIPDDALSSSITLHHLTG